MQFKSVGKEFIKFKTIFNVFLKQGGIFFDLEKEFKEFKEFK